MTREVVFAILAIAVSPALHAQVAPTAQPTAPPLANLTFAMPIAGAWSYAPTAAGSQATFSDAYGRAQLWIDCTRANRSITIAKPASAGAPNMTVWTSAQQRSMPASFSAATSRISIQLAAFDKLLDAMTSSRGRIGFAIAGQPALVVPPWADVGRVVEDCRV